MKIIGMTRIRNEQLIIKDTINHLASFCNEIYVYDDHSTDDTYKICVNHPKVTKVIRGKS